MRTLYNAIGTASMLCAFLLATLTRWKEKRPGFTWIRGTFFYRNGIELFLFVIISSFLSWVFIPALHELLYIELLIPTILVCEIRELPLSFAVDDTTLSKYVLANIRLQEIPLHEIHRISLFHTDSGSLIAIERTGADLFSCRSFVSFIRYRIRHRKALAFLPIDPELEEYARSVLSEAFHGTIQKKGGILFVFPLFEKRKS